MNHGGPYRHAGAFSIKDLEILVHLANGCTQAQTADRVALEQPAISKHLRAAERRSGIALIAHDGRRTSLTQGGLAVAALAQEILEKYAALEELCAASQLGERQPVRLLTSGTPATYVLPEVIASYLQRYPDDRIETDVHFRGVSLEGAFAASDFDLAILIKDQPSAEFSIETLYVDRFVLFVARGHPLLRRREPYGSGLRDLKLITKSSVAEWPAAFAGLVDLGFAREHIVEFLSYEGVKQLVRRNMGVGMLFESSVRDELASGEFVLLPAQPAFLTFPFSLVRRVSASEGPAVRRLHAFLLEHFRRAAA